VRQGPATGRDKETAQPSPDPTGESCPHMTISQTETLRFFVSSPGGLFLLRGVEWGYWFGLPLRCFLSPEVQYVC
jgi:hypothetical protein